jgi:hypothetical protein
MTKNQIIKSDRRGPNKMWPEARCGSYDLAPSFVKRRDRRSQVVPQTPWIGAAVAAGKDQEVASRSYDEGSGALTTPGSLILPRCPPLPWRVPSAKGKMGSEHSEFS